MVATDSSSTKYIVTCFQGEFGNVPFVRFLQKKKEVVEQAPEVPDKEQQEEEAVVTNLQVQEPAAVVESVKTEQDRETSDGSSEKPNVISKEDSVS